MKEITMWEGDDGEVYQTTADAAEADMRYRVKNWLQAFRFDDAKELACILINNRNALLKLLDAVPAAPEAPASLGPMADDTEIPF